MRLLTVVLALATSCALADTTQEHLHIASHDVMPFDMSKTLHIFMMNEQGGIQKVVVRDGAPAEQVELIRQHLQHEAAAFAKGDFADPSHLHGSSMPGLRELKAHVDKMHVIYSPIVDGAQIAFEAADLHTITAIHRWFGAQLSEHGADARAE